jgi:hypothetical protein
VAVLRVYWLWVRFFRVSGTGRRGRYIHEHSFEAMREADRFFRLLYKLPRTQMHGIAGNANALRERLYSVLEDGRDVHVHSSPGCFWCSFPCARLCGTRSVPCIFYIIQIIVSLLWCSWHGDVFCSALEAVAIISNEIFEILRACFRWRADNALRKKKVTVLYHAHRGVKASAWCTFLRTRVCRWIVIGQVWASPSACDIPLIMILHVDGASPLGARHQMRFRGI